MVWKRDEKLRTDPTSFVFLWVTNGKILRSVRKFLYFEGKQLKTLMNAHQELKRP